MEIHRWLAFAAAALLMGVLPGPGVANIVGFALGSGRRVAFAAIGGAVSGSVIAMLLSLAGAGAVLEASPVGYRLLEAAGALYLIVLGVLAWRGAARATAGAPGRVAAPRTAFLASVGVSATNPKSILFFVAFAPQFVDPARDYAAQAAILVATFAGAIALTDSGYALAASRAATAFRSAAAIARVRRASGALLVAIGAVALVAR